MARQVKNFSTGSPAHIEALESRAYLSVNLTDVVSIAAPASLTLTAGKTMVMSVTVSNTGTTAATGSLLTDLDISASAAGSSLVTLGGNTRHIKLAPGAQTTFRVTEKVPVTTAPGPWYAVAIVDPNAVFGKAATAVSPTAVIVQSKYPNAVGTWTGAAQITSGVGKGLSITNNFTLSSENQNNGTFVFTGSSVVDGVTMSFKGTGVASTTGRVTAKATHLAPYSGGITMNGALKNGTSLIYKFVSTTRLGISSGSGTATFQGLPA